MVAANCASVPVVRATFVIAPLLPLTVVTPVDEVRYVAVSTVQVPEPLVFRKPEVPVSAAIALKSASYACTFVPMTSPSVVCAAEESASSISDRPNDVRVVSAAVPEPVKYGSESAADVSPAIAPNSTSYA